MNPKTNNRADIAGTNFSYKHFLKASKKRPNDEYLYIRLTYGKKSTQIRSYSEDSAKFPLVENLKWSTETLIRRDEKIIEALINHYTRAEQVFDVKIFNQRGHSGKSTYQLTRAIHGPLMSIRAIKGVEFFEQRGFRQFLAAVKTTLIGGYHFGNWTFASDLLKEIAPEIYKEYKSQMKPYDLMIAIYYHAITGNIDWRTQFEYEPDLRWFDESLILITILELIEDESYSEKIQIELERNNCSLPAEEIRQFFIDFLDGKFQTNDLV